MQVLKIDENGYLLFGEEIFIENEEIPIDYIGIPLPKDTNGNQLPFYKPRWDGVKWVEGMPTEEINSLNNQPRGKTEIELLKEQNNDLNLQVIDIYEILLIGGII